MNPTKTNSNPDPLLIVGSGLAGSCLVLQCLQLNIPFHWCHDPNREAQSNVAAGIWNPIVFKRFVPSWKIDELLPELYALYSFAEKLLQCNFIRAFDIEKLFTESQEENLWKKKAAEIPYLSPHTFSSHPITQGHYGKVSKAGNLNIPLFREKLMSYCRDLNLLTESEFQFSALEIKSHTAVYRSVNYANIIFCEGHYVTANPYFQFVRLKPAKGEILNLRIPNFEYTNIINKGVFLMPLTQDEYKLGATYGWDFPNAEITPEAAIELKGKLASFFPFPFHIQSQQAGIRPASIDRRPIVGRHPQHTSLSILNGLGTKGVMLAPYFSKHLLFHLTQNTPIDVDVTVSRFYTAP